MAKKVIEKTEENPQISTLIYELETTLSFKQQRYDDEGDRSSFMPEYMLLKKAKEAVEDYEKKQKIDPKLLALKNNCEELARKIAFKQLALKKRFQQLRRAYYANGATPKVVEAFQKFVDDMGKGG